MVQEKLDVKLSIIIPVYNTANYLERCLVSIINSVITNNYNCLIEVLVLNDGSQDHSQQIIELYASKYSFIKGYSHQNRGLSETRNIGISLAKGEYLWFIDSDDYIKQIDLCNLVSFISKADIDICYFRYREGPEVEVENLELNLNVANVLTADDFFTNIEFTGHAWLYIFKKNILGEIRFDKGKTYEDIAFTIEVFTKANKFYYINQAIYEYYINPNSIIRKKNNYSRDYKLCEDLVFACNRIVKFLDENGKDLSSAKRKGIEKRLEHLVYFLLATLTFKKLSYRDIKRLIKEMNFKKFRHLNKSEVKKYKMISKIYNSFVLRSCYFYLISYINQ